MYERDRVGGLDPVAGGRGNNQTEGEKKRRGGKKREVMREESCNYSERSAPPHFIYLID